MQNIPISFAFAGLPAGYCVTSPERFALDITAGLSGYLPGEFARVIVSDTPPTDPDDRLGTAWYNTNDSRWYHFDGTWISKHPTEASGDERRMWVGSEVDLWSYDGGNGDNPTTDPPTSTTGTMWIVDTAFNFRFPIGPGTSAAATTIAVGDTGGAEKHTLTVAELPAHSHTVPLVSVVARDNDGPSDDFEPRPPGSTQDSGETGGDTPFSIMPPYIGTYIIKRTNRIWYTVPNP